MNRSTLTVLATLMLFGLTACESGVNAGGTADYDALKRAQADCAAQGGKLVLKDQGDALASSTWSAPRRP